MEDEQGGQRVLVLRDPDSLASSIVPMGLGAIEVLRLLDGARTFDDVHEALSANGALPREVLESFLAMLDRQLLLDNAASRSARVARTTFLEGTTRAAAHAGRAYPAAPDAARTFLDAMLPAPLRTPSSPPPLRRVLAPHIDLGLGSATYGHAHQRILDAGRPDVVVVLGVRHEFAEERFIACRKDFATPLGVVPCDHPLLDAIEERFGSLDADVVAHQREHSVEFQAIWLARHWPDDPPPMVPLLLGGFFDCVREQRSPRTDEEVERFIGALRDAIAADGRRVLVLASVDFSHVGPLYEDDAGLDEAGELELAEKDNALLDQVVANDAEAFFASIAADGDARHICGTAPVYVTMRLHDGPGELLHYGQGRIHPESGSVVSFAAVAFAD